MLMVITKQSLGYFSPYTLFLISLLFCSENQDRKVLDQYLARALGLPLEKGKCLSAIDDSNYVLTLDYTIKMLNIHERYECGVPVIIKGETGVGKTALVEMLSRLWSHALLHLWNKEKGTINDAIRNLVSKKAEDSLDNYQKCVEICEAITSGQEVPIDDFIILGQIPDSTTETGQFYSHLKDLLLDMATNPAVALLKLSNDKGEEETTSSLDDMFELARTANSPEVSFAHSLSYFLSLLFALSFLLLSFFSLR